MNEQENVLIIQQSYATLERGDIAALLNGMTDDVEWETPGPPDVLPFAGALHGREQVAQFFTQLSEAMESAQFEPHEFIAQGDKVVVLGRGRYRVRRTGQSYEENFAAAYTLREGKLTKFRSYGDTAAAVKAFLPQQRA